MKKQEVILLYEKYIMPTYTRYPIVLARGKGSWVWDSVGKKYLDFFPGWGVSGLGHCHPRVVAAIKKQAGALLHVPNNYRSAPQAELAREIVEHSFPGKVFFGNSGAEANEAAVKLARAWGADEGRYEVISLENSFHGRTLATLALTGQKKYGKGFEPLPEGFKTVPFGQLKAMEETIGDKTVAVIVEPVQGEGGVNVCEKSYLEGLRGLCDKKKLLLIFDEVQTGMGRLGRWFGYQCFGVAPDIITLAKNLGGGVPIGAAVARDKIADTLKPGMHASTFGGSPIVSAAALAVFETIAKENLLDNVRKMSEYIFGKLAELKTKHSVIKEVRGLGLMIGIELAGPGKNIVEKCLAKGLLINCTHERVLRLMPAFTIGKKEADLALTILEDAFGEEG